MNDTYQQLSLQDWLWIGEQTGRITTFQSGHACLFDG